MLICLEGVDRSGKSSVAEHYKSLGYEYIHFKAPDKKYTMSGYTGPSYCDDMVELLMSFAGRNVICDRSWYGERVWPYVYGRQPLLTEDDIEVLREIEVTLDVKRILMVDPNTEAHWSRCVVNNEPMDRMQFNLANQLYSEFPLRYGFEVVTLPEFKESLKKTEEPPKPDFSLEAPKVEASDLSAFALPKEETMTEEQKRLAYANAVNSLLSKPLIKKTEWPFNELEGELKTYLNNKLGVLLGQPDNFQLSTEDVRTVKEFIKILQAKQKK